MPLDKNWIASYRSCARVWQFLLGLGIAISLTTAGLHYMADGRHQESLKPGDLSPSSPQTGAPLPEG